MSFNTFGKIFRFTTWGESHGPAIGCIVDGCPPNISISEKEIQKDMDKRRPGQSKFTTQRKESDKVSILSGVFQGKTTGTPISMIIYNEDKRSRDYESIKDKFRPGHADFTYFKKYGIRDYRGGGRQSARETASRVAAGAIAKIVLKKIIGKKFNIVGAEELNNLELAQIIASCQNKELKYEMVDFHSSRPGHDLRYSLSGEKMKKLGWQPSIKLTERIKQVVDWSLNNQNWIEL